MISLSLSPDRQQTVKFWRPDHLNSGRLAIDEAWLQGTAIYHWPQYVSDLSTANGFAQVTLGPFDPGQTLPLQLFTRHGNQVLREDLLINTASPFLDEDATLMIETAGVFPLPVAQQARLRIKPGEIRAWRFSPPLLGRRVPIDSVTVTQGAGFAQATILPATATTPELVELLINQPQMEDAMAGVGVQVRVGAAIHEASFLMVVEGASKYPYKLPDCRQIIGEPVDLVMSVPAEPLIVVADC